MTLVQSYVCSDYALICTDRRMTYLNNTDKYKDVVYKQINVNKDVILAFSGDVKLSQKLGGFIAAQNFKKATVQSIASKLKAFLQAEEGDQRIHIAGVGDDDKMTLITLGSEDGYKINEVVPSEGELRWQTSYANLEAEPLISAKVKECIEKGEVLDAHAVADIAIEINEQVSAQDNFVSRSCDLQFIDKWAEVAR